MLLISNQLLITFFLTKIKLTIASCFGMNVSYLLFGRRHACVYCCISNIVFFLNFRNFVNKTF